MKKFNKVEQQLGRPLSEVLFELYQKQGSQRGVAEALTELTQIPVSQNSVWFWMQLCGLSIQQKREVTKVKFNVQQIELTIEQIALT